MAKLSDQQLASLLEEIACSMRADTPVADAMSRLQHRRLGVVGRAAGVIAEHLSLGNTLSVSVGKINAPLAAQAAGAVEVCERSGNSELLQRMAEQLRQRAEYTRNSRAAWLYPLLLLAMGYLVAVLVMAPLIRRFEGRDFAWPPIASQATKWLETNWHYPPLILLGVLIVLCLWLETRNRFSRPVRVRLFAQSLADQLAHGVVEDIAIKNAAAMSGIGGFDSESQASLQSATINRILSQVTVVDVEGVNEQDTLIARLRFIAAIHAERARKHHYFWGRLLPRFAMICVGGGFVFVYVWWVIAPVYRQVAQW